MHKLLKGLILDWVPLHPAQAYTPLPLFSVSHLHLKSDFEKSHAN